MTDLGNSFAECASNMKNTVTACLTAQEEGKFPKVKKEEPPILEENRANNQTTTQKEKPKDLFLESMKFIKVAEQIARSDPKFNFEDYTMLLNKARVSSIGDNKKLATLRDATRNGDQLNEMTAIAIERGQLVDAENIIAVQKRLEADYLRELKPTPAEPALKP